MTGAASGIGSCYSRRLAAQGYSLIIADINIERLQGLKLQLQEECDVDIHTLEIDLAEEGSSVRLFELTKQIADVEVLINNAGIFCFRDVVECSVERISRILMLHNMNIALTCRLFSEDMIARGVEGHILNMSSYSVWMPFPGLSLYSASKAFVRSFSIAFAKEVREHNIWVTAVCPAGVATDFYGLPSNLQKLGCRLGVLITPDSCARRALRAMWRKRKSTVPDWWNVIFIPFAMAMPRFVIDFIRRKTLQFQK